MKRRGDPIRQTKKIIRRVGGCVKNTVPPKGRENYKGKARVRASHLCKGLVGRARTITLRPIDTSSELGRMRLLRSLLPETDPRRNLNCSYSSTPGIQAQALRWTCSKDLRSSGEWKWEENPTRVKKKKVLSYEARHKGKNTNISLREWRLWHDKPSKLYHKNKVGSNGFSMCGWLRTSVLSNTTLHW